MKLSSKYDAHGNTGSYLRHPAVAGPNGFYPSDPSILVAQIEDYIAGADPAAGSAPFGIIAPHAGYIYSGHVAGWAYRQIRGGSFDTVIVLAPSHFESFPFASILPHGCYRTPLGDIPIDSGLAEEISKCGGEAVRLSTVGHFSRGARGEHALEVQLPFLQATLGEFSFVPILMGTGGWTLCSRVAEAVDRAVNGKEVLVVASSDLSHYHDYQTANRIDGSFIEALKTLDPEEIADGCNLGRYEACGGAPISVLLEAARLRGANDLKILKHANSGDVAFGDKSMVVGYLAAGIWKGPDVHDVRPVDSAHKAHIIQSDQPPDLTDAEKSALLAAARDAVTAKLTGGAEPPSNPSAVTPTLMQHRAMFVTIKKLGSLRGCVGQLTPTEPLFRAVSRIAVQAALSDYRFAPLQAKELPIVKFEITVLGDLQVVSSVDEIVIGQHGVVVSDGENQGLLLPQVAVEHLWNAATFLDHACAKAGLPQSEWRNKRCVVSIFAAVHFLED